jgi:hypothetical protein
MKKFQISPELQACIPPLRPEEFDALKAKINAEGMTESLVVWVAPDGTRTLLDGHNRYRICSELKLPYKTKDVLLPDIQAAKAWMLEHQRARRNLSQDQRIALDIRAGVQPKEGSALKISGARKLLEGAPDLFDAVLRGKLGILAGVNELALLRKAPSAPSSVVPITRRAPKKGRIHVVIGDTQVKPGVPTDHLTWIGRYIVEQFLGQNIAIVHLGDHWDMPSLSSYDQGKKEIEGKRYLLDVQAGNEAFARLNDPIEKASTRWKPERHFLFGNHEERINRACNDAAFLDGKLSLDDLETPGWQRHQFLQPFVLDGISYCHYFYHPNTSKPYAGENVETRLKTIGRSFTMGHQQGRKWGERQVGDTRHQGLVLGSTYLHDEGYHGPQGNAYWRGIVICHQVEAGTYDPMFVSLDYLCRRYEGMILSEFLAAKQSAA